jgi:hypothetical protein
MEKNAFNFKLSQPPELEEYRKIVLFSTINGRKLQILSHFFSYFSPKDIFFKVIGDKLIIFVRQLDFSYFCYKLRQFARLYSEDEINILQQIAENIEKIKNYGLKGKKKTLCRLQSGKKSKG